MATLSSSWCWWIAVFSSLSSTVERAVISSFVCVGAHYCRSLWPRRLPRLMGERTPVFVAKAPSGVTCMFVGYELMELM